MRRWCATPGASAASLTAPRPTGSWSATGCRCWGRATSNWSLTASTNCRSGLAFARSMVFPRGLPALDDLDEATLGTRPSLGHVTAREEVTSLLRQLKLPLDERGRRRAANRAEWFTQVDKPLEELHDILGA